MLMQAHVVRSVLGDFAAAITMAEGSDTYEKNKDEEGKPARHYQIAEEQP